MPKSYDVGARRAVYGQNHKLSESRYAWLQCEAGKFLILVGEDVGHGPDVVLFHPRPGKQPDISIMLTNLTIEELDAMKDLFNSALDWARPVVERRDKEAEDAWNEGDDSHARNYRALPTLVYRKRPEFQHGEGVHERPEGVPDGVRGLGGDDDGVRGAGTSLAEHDPQQRQSEDDSSSPNDTEELR